MREDEVLAVIESARSRLARSQGTVPVRDQQTTFRPRRCPQD